MVTRHLSRCALTLGLALAGSQLALAQSSVTLLNVSYDPTRELYVEFNAAFAKYWKGKTGQTVTIRQSHAGAAKQARAVIDGLEADVVTLALAYDIDALHEKANLIPKDWQKRLPHNSAPYTSTIVFLVRKGNPRGIKDWDDLAKPRYRRGHAESENVRRCALELPGGLGLCARTTRRKRRQGQGLRWKDLQERQGAGLRAPAARSRPSRNVASAMSSSRGRTRRSWPSRSLAPRSSTSSFPASRSWPSRRSASIDKVVDKRGTREVATAYLKFWNTPEAQEIAGRHYYRPRDPKALEKYGSQFAKVRLVTIDEVFGGWQKAQRTHFADGGIFDQIYRRN